MDRCSSKWAGGGVTFTNARCTVGVPATGYVDDSANNKTTYPLPIPSTDVTWVG